MRVVIDTNELLRMASGGNKSQLMLSWRDQKFDLLISLATLTELRTVLSRPAIQKYIPEPVGQQFLILCEQRAKQVQPDLSAPTCRDPKDTSLIATAVGGHAHFLITSDPDLLDDEDLIKKLADRGVKIIRAGEFLERINF